MLPQLLVAGRHLLVLNKPQNARQVIQYAKKVNPKKLRKCANPSCWGTEPRPHITRARKLCNAIPGECSGCTTTEVQFVTSVCTPLYWQTEYITRCCKIINHNNSPHDLFLWFSLPWSSRSVSLLVRRLLSLEQLLPEIHLRLHISFGCPCIATPSAIHHVSALY